MHFANLLIHRACGCKTVYSAVATPPLPSHLAVLGPSCASNAAGFLPAPIKRKEEEEAERERSECGEGEQRRRGVSVGRGSREGEE